jgi:anti-sigma B factor antagonist
VALRRERGSSKTKGLCKLAIDEDMTIYAIKELTDALTDELDGYDRFELSLAKVEEVDSAGIQLLLALSTELEKRNKQFKVTEVSGAVSKLLATYNISDRFDTGAAA